MLVSVRYVTGDFDAQIPVPTLIDWTGPQRKVIASWPRTGPLAVTLDSDGWSLGDGIPGPMAVLPNPFAESQFLVINNQVSPKYISATFGWVAPPLKGNWHGTLLCTCPSSLTLNPQSLKTTFQEMQAS